MRLGARARESLAKLGIAETLRAGVNYLHWRLKGAPPPPLTREISSANDWMEAYACLRPESSDINRQTRFSIVCPVHDSPPGLLVDCVESVLAQTHENWELILIDDGSILPAMKDTLSLLAQRDERIRVTVLAGHEGVAAANAAGADDARGEYVVFLSESDRISPTALEWVATCCPEADLVYTDEDRINHDGSHWGPFFKPSWSPRLLLSLDYADHLVCIRRSKMQEVGGIGPRTDGVHIHDLLLRLSGRDITVAHVPILACHRYVSGEEADGGLDPLPNGAAVGRDMLQRALGRRGWNATAVTVDGDPTRCRVVFRETTPRPLVKIVMPTRDQVVLLRRAVDGVLEATDGVDVHLVIVDNGSVESQTAEFLQSIAVAHTNVTVLTVDEPFNFSRLSNLGATAGPDAPYVLFLNNDIEVIHQDWLLQMVGWLREDPDVVGVGAKLLYPDGRIQHAGMIVGFAGLSGHYAARAPNRPTVGSLHDQAREIGCLTAACLLVRADDFQAVGGFLEELPIDFQDVDLSLRLRSQLDGVLMYDPTHPVVHHESATRGVGDSSEETIERMKAMWGDVLAAEDPYYSPHLSLRHQDLSMREVPNDVEMMRHRLQPRWSGGTFSGVKPVVDGSTARIEKPETAESDPG
jgi:GT2 family glycosyltransferase